MQEIAPPQPVAKLNRLVGIQTEHDGGTPSATEN
jgi:hypothetical protein